MKPLNRPMFRYGGPIKEGVMSGIREPKKDGGSMSQLVKPNNDGSRPGYAGPATPFILAGMGLRALAPYAVRAARPVMNFFKGTAPTTVRKGLGRTRVPTTTERMSSLFRTSPAGQYLMRSPEGRLISGGAGYAGKAGRGLLKGGKYLASSPLTLATAGYYGGKALLPDGTPDPNAPGGPDGPPSVLNPPGSKKGGLDKPPPGVQLTDKEKRAQQIEKYRDIMDIKGMNKAAAYDSLIAASQAVNQAGGDLKGAIRDGSLINQIIQSTSKAFDKPAKTKDAIDTLILKGEIEKDIKASDPSNILDAEYKRAKIAESKEKLNPSFNTLKAGYGKDNKGQSGIDLAAAEYSDNQGQTFRGNIISKSDFNEIKEDIKEKSGAVDEITIITSWTNATIKGKDVPDGNYTVGDKIVTIKDNVVIAVE